jgi:DNA polymerase-3 subunit alpha
MADVPIDDESTALMLRRGDTEGCFQIESNVMTKIILRMNVTSVEDLISVVALGRPGPLDSGMVETFLKRRNKQ